MTDTPEILDWHAHIYYVPETRDRAAELRAAIEKTFAALDEQALRVGRWRDMPVGPHPQPMYQVAFAPELFATFVPWLVLNRQGLDVLVHATTTNSDLWDHTQTAMWLGRSLELNLDVFR